ncbi:hypothetical protein PPYR_03816 [Photinus pyralis]|uniref:sulfite oxidase n=1 Tax=Photinus pyralis TaxID=7054 RepID=A0A5N4AWL6_PHOPY|nr:probable sulfite oxidase, mitochondrial isoform X2 [Photinus pyralis]KAB0801630.1 hypothetical protein PPYR_03816 [Photinus pyralis]
MYKYIRLTNTLRYSGERINNGIRLCCTHEFNSNKHRSRSHTAGLLFGAAVSSLLAYKIYKENKFVYLKEAEKQINTDKYGAYQPNLPEYSLEEVTKHATKSTKIWVIFRRGVYDITSFVEEHPGGDQIMLGAGNSIEPFWLLYGVHNQIQIYEMLEKMRIGNISEKDAGESVKDMSDPYHNDPKRHPILKPASVKPFNAEAPLSLLADNFISPNELFYVRNHLPVPEVDISTYELEVEVEGTKKKLVLSFKDLERLQKHTITATIMCAGNRRSEMSKLKTVKGLDWGCAAIGNATYTGVRLRDVLDKVGIKEGSDYKHVQFEGLDTDSTGKSYGASIPFWRAVDKKCDVLLAYEMNGKPLPKDHGFPIRVVVPGVVGARNVKWLGKIVVSQNESDSHWQQNDYKGFSPSIDWDNVDFSTAPAIQELPVTSAICKPAPGSTVKIEDGCIFVQEFSRE